jgi:Spy/CpxP family protein refolding chaperone
MMRNWRAAIWYTVTACGLGLLFLGATTAQPPGRRPDDKKDDKQPDRRPDGPQRGGPGNLFERVTKDLDLTDKQKDKLKDVFAAHEKRMREVFEKGQGGSTREMMQKLHTELLNDLKGVLTADQLKTVEAALQAGPGRGPGDRDPRGRPDGPPRGGPGGNIFEMIQRNADLSDKQKSQLEEIRASHEKKMRELQEKFQKDLKGVLTEEQLKKVEEAARRGPGRDGPPERRPER